jgi:ectoine hydroxylase-related dioxygenase (phytanoyl-CoA dioxygenase family)
MTSALKQQFERDGYLLGIPILSREEVIAVNEQYQRLKDSTQIRSAKGRITNQHLLDPAFYALATRKEVLDLVEVAVGPDILLISSGFFDKPPGSGNEFVAWHQDTMYWGLEPPLAVTVWIALDDSDVENGCMRVIPGTHHSGLLPHSKSKQPGNVLAHDQEIPSEYLDASKAVDFILRAGQASLHHGELVHGSNPNRSNRRRCGMTVRYTRPDVKPVRNSQFPFSEKPILVRGEDRFGHFDLITPSWNTSQS